ncbi:MAG: hypothetical protein Ta2A_15810 [Treponemataceae bacterium]|nr:MAG: hypothetical protein Ta2A_15810 [Treponemataceae bacterium]
MRKVLLCTLYLASWVVLQTCTGFYNLLPTPLASYELVGSPKSEKNIMLKFGITGTDEVAVRKTFMALHAFIEDCRIKAENTKGDAKENFKREVETVIKYFDYIDLPYLNIAYSNVLEGSPSNLTNVRLNNGAGSSLRMEVVGIDSFFMENFDNAKHHIVFQFQHTIGKSAMKSGSVTVGGYSDSIVRSLLVPGYTANSGVIFKALLKSGVPEETILPVKRRVASPKGNPPYTYDDRNDITDKLWIPTEYEVRGEVLRTIDTVEGKNGLFFRLDCYVKNPGEDIKTKYYVKSNNPASIEAYPDEWWLASPGKGNGVADSGTFCIVRNMPTAYESDYPDDSGETTATSVSTREGIAPAFCVM